MVNWSSFLIALIFNSRRRASSPVSSKRRTERPHLLAQQWAASESTAAPAVLTPPRTGGTWSDTRGWSMPLRSQSLRNRLPQCLLSQQYLLSTLKRNQRPRQKRPRTTVNPVTFPSNTWTLIKLTSSSIARRITKMPRLITMCLPHPQQE